MEMTLEGVTKQTISQKKSSVTLKDAATARSFIYQFLARAYQYPDPNGWAWLNDSGTQTRLWSAVRLFCQEATDPLRKSAEEFALYLGAEEYESFYKGYMVLFGRGMCPLNETAYLQARANALSATQHTSLLAGYYREHGLVPTARRGERIDHICFECEFMAALAAKEACANGRDESQTSDLAAAQAKFVLDHLSAWIPAFTRRLKVVSAQHAFTALALFTQSFIERECERFEVRARKPVAQSLELAAKV
jgi:TorA maturation chaperone TorD